MMTYRNKIDVFENLISFKDEYEWLDFKENWFSKDEIGEDISASQTELLYLVENMTMLSGESAIPIRKIALSESDIKKNMRILKRREIIERICADKNGYWSFKSGD